MKKPEPSRRPDREKVRPGREHWWWRENRLPPALDANPELDHFFHWKVKGRKSPRGAVWTSVQRRTIETALWLYELDARVSHRFLFGKPVHLLAPEQLASVIGFAWPMHAPTPKPKSGPRSKDFAWAWIEYFDQRDEPNAPKLTRAELNGIIAAMKYCLGYFLHK